MAPKFVYFDLGKVLVDFDVHRMYRQIGEAAGVDPVRVREVLFFEGLQTEHERGKITAEEFHAAFCERTASRVEPASLERAASDIFELNVSIVPVVAQLEQAGCRLGILSNTCGSHWEHCRRRFRIVAECFRVTALSYRLRAAKPDPAIFRAAAELAGAAPEEIFFTDDTAGHVAGARAAGFDAVQYTSAPQLAAELRRRGLRFNY